MHLDGVDLDKYIYTCANLEALVQGMLMHDQLFTILLMSSQLCLTH